VLGKSRSNDAYGNSRHAYLGFIPIAGLWLLFTPSKSLQTNHITSNLSGAAAVIIGIFIFSAGNFYQQYSGKMIDDYFIASTEDEALTNRIRDRMISYYISKNELEAALAYVRSFEDIGANYNESLILNDVVIQNNIMEYQFIYTEINNVELTKEMQDNLKEAICADYRQLISAGASIVWQFDNNIQQVLGRIIADRDLCAF
jgi:hypothetical protein